VWEDDRDMDTEVYYKRSTDGGATWGPDVHVTITAGPQGLPSVAVVSDYVHVTWADFTLIGNSEIYYGRSTDGGATWETPTQISYGAGYSSSPSITAYESDIHIAWQDSRFAWYNNEIFYRHSSDDGVTWGNESRLTEDTTFSNAPSIGVSANYVHVVWEEMRDGNFEIYYKRSTDYGQTWGQDIRLTDDTGESHYPSLAVSGSNVHIVWIDNRDGNEEIYYKNSIDNGTTWSADTRLTDNMNASQNASLAVCGEKVHVVWQDDRHTNWEIYYKRNPTGNTYVDEYENARVLQLNLVVSPNPFSERTTFIINSRSMTINGVLNIYSATGRLVESFRLTPDALRTTVTWDGTDQANRSLPSGIYFVQLSADDYVKTKKVLLIR
ncbi:MAG: exo-alpha-sialidase, partial [candidate division WOR-3 bacterium]